MKRKQIIKELELKVMEFQKFKERTKTGDPYYLAYTNQIQAYRYTLSLLKKE